MKYLGIDYGTKRIGLAVSDKFGTIAFPKEIIENDENSLKNIKNIINDEHIEKIIVGKSMDLLGNENKVQREIQSFIKKLQSIFDGDIIEQDERMSSVAARSHLYGKGNIANERWTKKENKKRQDPVDAGAAAIILQRFLDRLN